MAYLALDLSKRSAGWAKWLPGMAVPECGHWELGDECTSDGMVFVRLHQRMNEVHTATPLLAVAAEQPLLIPGNAKSNRGTQEVLMGLVAHAASFCAAKRIQRFRQVSIDEHREHFIGRCRGFKKDRNGKYLPGHNPKVLAVEACLALGISVTGHDSAEACAILDRELCVLGIPVPWRAPRGGDLFGVAA